MQNFLSKIKNCPIKTGLSPWEGVVKCIRLYPYGYCTIYLCQFHYQFGRYEILKKKLDACLHSVRLSVGKKLCFLCLHFPKFFYAIILSCKAVTVSVLVCLRCRFLTYVYKEIKTEVVMCHTLLAVISILIARHYFHLFFVFFFSFDLIKFCFAG